VTNFVDGTIWWTIGADGRQEPIGEFEGVPATVAGLAAS
jgi:hypothetical protein